ncbi:MAG: hypothetical protein M0P32_05235 [Bacteroidales bacterium]|nr:hypothetical protein [Bacteroidales bacterium]MDD2576998.1 hypothetical protein [Bacteroidales bacterium]MDD4068065.1 hypothetical protein [Bacteroidales bacterium]MDD4584776.1 hypothetical protein [Bacilli bacterium]
MIVKYKLENSFGPIGSAAGKFILLASIISMIFIEISIFAILFVILGAFMGLSKSDIFIDSDNSKIRFSTTVFGLIKTGKWISVDDSMEVGIRKNFEKWQVIGRSNKHISVASDKYKIVLYKSGKPYMTLKYVDSIEEAEKELNRFANLLGME